MQTQGVGSINRTQIYPIKLNLQRPTEHCYKKYKQTMKQYVYKKETKIGEGFQLILTEFITYNRWYLRTSSLPQHILTAWPSGTNWELTKRI